MEEFGFEKLDVWRKSMEVVDQIYAITKTFPQVELFGLSSQMRRAAVSMPSNIAEGHGRKQGIWQLSPPCAKISL